MKSRYIFLFFLIFLGLIPFFACKNAAETEETPSNEPALFTLLAPEKTHVDFQNTITEGLNTNVLMYEYFYNGGGVAVGDINNDGLDDIYFTSNMQTNRLYLNKGNMVFQDITAAAGVSGRDGPWKTGTTMADVNGDGLLDIYVCYSGNLSPEKRANQLFINQGSSSSGGQGGDVTFVEKAAAYGLNSFGTSTQATFFDFDKDGDLDMFLLNHNPKSLPVLDEASTADIIKKDDPNNGMRLFRQDKSATNEPFFTDITVKAGLLSSALSYGLGAGIADFNGDGWTDMYVSNDYAIPDFLYINNKKGGFINQINESIGHTSHFSMGSDAADINNDALPDIFTLDMLPESNRRQKLLMAPDNYEKFDFNVKVGFGHQYMRNMLQINQGNSSSGGQVGIKDNVNFSEVGQLAGISNTDWSWSALFADYDNDGWKDLYVTNGYFRDYTNLDFLKYMGDYQQANGKVKRQDVLDLVQKMPSSNLTNYLFQNKGNSSSGGWGATFKNVGWGTSKPSNSNGAAYADLDNDGDLDLIVNNINQAAFIYQNEADKQLKNHYLNIKLNGEGQNRFGIGAKITIQDNGQLQYLEQMPTRGYQSSVSPILHFGLGQTSTIESLKIVWLSGKEEVIQNISGDKLLVLEEKNAKISAQNAQITEGVIFKEIPSPIVSENTKNTLNDFKRQPLLTNPLSFVSPCLTKGDVNGDGLEDVYVGGASGQAGALYCVNKNGSFTLKPQPAFELDKQSEDADAVFFDANSDGFNDLYVCSGGYANFQPEDAALQDRLYMNDGKGNFTKNANALPKNLSSKNCVKVADINSDGKPDLFIGGRVVVGRYPEAPLSMLLINDGKGNFSDQTTTLIPSLARIGMVTDAAFYDLNKDTKPELIVVGEFMPITIYGLNNGKWADVTPQYFDKKYSGLWTKLVIDDFNGDGKADLIVGNLGLNSQLKASEKEPLELYYKDFDDNGSIDPILCTYIKGKSYPYITRDELLDQMSMMRTRFPDYKSYADATIKDVFKSGELNGATHLVANTLKTTLFIRDANNKFQEKELPIEVQASPIFAITTLDLSPKDGTKDLVLAGNINHARLKFGKYDANYGLLLRGDGQGNFSTVPQRASGFNLKGDVRSVLEMKDMLIFGVNQAGLKAYKMR
jgi:enediyne biosynthesis protein E4